MSAANSNIPPRPRPFSAVPVAAPRADATLKELTQCVANMVLAFNSHNETTAIWFDALRSGIEALQLQTRAISDRMGIIEEGPRVPSIHDAEDRLDSDRVREVATEAADARLLKEKHDALAAEEFRRRARRDQFVVGVAVATVVGILGAFFAGLRLGHG